MFRRKPPKVYEWIDLFWHHIKCPRCFNSFINGMFFKGTNVDMLVRKCRSCKYEWEIDGSL